MEDLEKQLLCPVCLELFSKPVVILPCQHNLCRKCATDVLQALNNFFPGGVGGVGGSGVSGSSGASGGGRFRCPSCRHEVLLDRHGVYGLQRNLLVENIIDIYRQHDRSSSGPSPVFCPEHPEERINIYCCRCETPTCSLCKVFGPHKDCEVAPLADVYHHKKCELSDGIAGLVAVNDHIQVLISQMEDICRTVEENGRGRRELVCQSVEGLVHILEQRKQELISLITEEQDERQRHVRALIRAHGQHLGVGVALVERGIHNMEHPHMSTFIQTAQEILKEMSESGLGPELPRLELGFENMSHFSIDVENLSHKLQNLHFCHESVNFDEDDENDSESELD
ncbi:tripartite motif-containing protein 54 [Boleophthalmus pectinirostris]|uniref:tripartite motif-containing protein 54 n=1 Tax=Boleophthalmus pectinirostris TaxID=150288 RepID=UPI002430B102|nr:tripartite motif-containing protein 54 [Boleophthalmus pectinirostris]